MRVLCCLLLCIAVCFADDVSDLELLGDDVSAPNMSIFVGNKNGFNVGLGLNYSNYYKDGIRLSDFSATADFGYTSFFNKYVGVRDYIFFDALYNRFYTGAGIDVYIDFLQTRYFGLGIIGGTTIGFLRFYQGRNAFLMQADVGVSVVFDSGKSRLQLLARSPYLVTGSFDKINTTYILSYIYNF